MLIDPGEDRTERSPLAGVAFTSDERRVIDTLKEALRELAPTALEVLYRQAAITSVELAKLSPGRPAYAFALMLCGSAREVMSE